MHLPIFHPTMTLFLDDDRLLLSALQLEFGDANNIFITDVKEALNVLNSSSSSLFEGVIVHNHDEDTGDDNYTVAFEKIYSGLFVSNRYQVPSVLVIDHSMPEMTGIEFCKKVQHLSCKKIMLTGNSSLDTAVDAFNDGIIDYFLKKDGNDLPDKLRAAITKLQVEYFTDITNGIMKYIEPAFSQVPEYNVLWHEVKNSCAALEYYLLDENGSYLFVGANHELHWMLVKEQKQIDEYADIAEGFEADDHLLALLKDYKEFPYFLTKADAEAPPDEWHKYLQPSKHLGGNLHCAVVRGEIFSELNWDKVKF